jgi:hypothetical protein
MVFKDALEKYQKGKRFRKKNDSKNNHQKEHMSCPTTILVNRSDEIHLNKTGQILP